MDNILITGVCGHIGSHLYKMIGNYIDCNVIGVDNMMTQRYCSLFDNSTINFKFIEDDFMNIDIPENSIVIHLAAITNAAGTMLNTTELENVNIEKTKQFIDKCIDSNVKKFIFPSSTSIYGVAADIVDEDNVLFENPQSPYAESKLIIERYLESKSEHLDYLIFRFGTIYGFTKGTRFHTAINKFCWQASINQPITVWEQNYEQVRPYLWISDACHSIVHAITNNITSRTKYNILSGNHKLSEIVNIIKQKVPNLSIKMVDTPLLNQYTYNVSDKKIKETGFVPNGALEISISHTLHNLKNLYNV